MTYAIIVLVLVVGFIGYKAYTQKKTTPAQMVKDGEAKIGGAIDGIRKEL